MIGRAVYNTPSGMAIQIGINRYRIINGRYIGRILEKRDTVTGFYYYVIGLECPSGYNKIIDSSSFPREEICQKVIVVNNNGKKNYPIPSENGNNENNFLIDTNWFLYGAIALGAYLLLKGD